MNVFKKALLSALYTISPTHCGIGQAAGAVDLPVAREAETRFPVFPATSLKGVARDFSERSGMSRDIVDRLFGKALDEGEKSGSIEAGALAFTEARLVAYPVRSLNRPFFHVTCPLILERLFRDLRALEISDLLPQGRNLPRPLPGQIQVADPEFAGKTIVLEDLVYPEGEVGTLPILAEIAEKLASLLPKGETDTANRLRSGLVAVPDEDFVDLVNRCTPVRARNKLSDETKSSENLWYEEYLPSDCLLVSFIGERRQRKMPTDTNSSFGDMVEKTALDLLKEYRRALEIVQIGGNETVGYGLCYWTFGPESQGEQ